MPGTGTVARGVKNSTGRLLETLSFQQARPPGFPPTCLVASVRNICRFLLISPSVRQWLAQGTSFNLFSFPPTIIPSWHHSASWRYMPSICWPSPLYMSSPDSPWAPGSFDSLTRVSNGHRKSYMPRMEILTFCCKPVLPTCVPLSVSANISCHLLMPKAPPFLSHSTCK